MIYAIRVLLVVVVLETVVGGALLARRAWRAVPRVPDEELNDPLIMPELRKFAREAEQGGPLEWTRFGEALLGKGFYAYAEPAFREALRRDGTSMAAQFGLAFALDRTGRMQESSREYRRVLDLKPTSEAQAMTRYYALFAMGLCALRLEQAEEAEDLFRQNAKFAPADYQYAKLLIRDGRAEEALPVIERVLKEVEYSLEFHYLHQRALEALGRTREAFQAATMVERSAYLVPASFNTVYVTPLDQMTGISRMLRELVDEVGDANLVGFESELLEIRQAMGDKPIFAAEAVDEQLLYVAGQRKQSERIFEMLKTYRAAGREAQMLDAEGDAWQVQGDLVKAAECWERALLLMPNLATHRKLAEYYGAREPELRDSHLGRIALLKGISEYRSNRLKQALKPLTEATQLMPQDPVAWYYIGEMNFHLQQWDAARAAYRKCLELRPSHGRAARKLAYLQEADQPVPAES
ncbi:MAG: tetratricopeptide repeat protein [Planctomycetaceae bacterium]